MRMFRLLTASEIECRISEINKQGYGLDFLLYKTARTDAALLDEVVGAERWCNDFKIINNNLYGGIGIKFENEWIWRWDCGSESNIEAEKGEASDAFKRAGYKWGIGTELYTAPKIWVPSSLCELKEKDGKYKCFDKFEVECISYSSTGAINGLSIINLSQTAKQKKKVRAFLLMPPKGE